MEKIFILFFALLQAVTVDSLTTSMFKKVIDSKTKTPANNYGRAIEIAGFIDQNTLRCLFQGGFKVAFIRVYQSTRSGTPDNDSITNIYNADNVGMGVEIYVEPQPDSIKSGSDQFKEMYTFLRTQSIAVKAVWIKITSPITWPNDQKANIDFINSFITEAWNYGVIAGIYTSWYDWQQITAGQVTYNQSQIPLWYWNMMGSGLDAATPPTFDDFRSFGGFKAPVVKQHAQNVCFCGICTSLDFFDSKATLKTFPANKKLKIANITVGNLSWMSSVMARSSEKQLKREQLEKKTNRNKIIK